MKRNVILVGDVREQLATLPDESVHCVVTSPPYWGLRDYGTASWAGGDEGCDHTPDIASRSTRPKGLLVGSTDTIDAGNPVFKTDCGKCGATRIDAQLGIEPTPEEYVANMVAVFREVRRVLRSDGTVWLNLGDSYAGSGRGMNGDGTSSDRNGAKHQTNAGSLIDMHDKRVAEGAIGRFWVAPPSGLKPKDLVGIPWRVAFALQADGWWLRSDIIWSKPNPMPESVTDRPTKAHEYLFLLSKSATYYYDHEAIREGIAPSQVGRVRQDTIGGNWVDGVRHSPGGVYTTSHAAAAGTLYEDGTNGGRLAMLRQSAREQGGEYGNPNGRNKRTVWEVATQPYAEAHFATYPEALVKPCILAGCPEGGVVLDPFFGSGTTGVVAKRAGRSYVGIELNPTYAAMAEKRIGSQEVLL